jgi:hypothetical protein
MGTRGNISGMAGSPPTRLVVFSDDWGRHPSSAQHLVSRLVARHPTIWVNTIGTRLPGYSWEDLQKIGVKLRQWMLPGAKGEGGFAADRAGGTPAFRGLNPGLGGAGANLTVITPRMWPGFRKPWQRRLNRRLIGGAVNRALGRRGGGERRVVVTTLPITADLVGRIDADGWVYYCVDDLAVWPGVDGAVMREMEKVLVQRARGVIAVSETLRERLAGLGREATLLTHGVDLEHWGRAPMGGGGLPEWWGGLRRPIVLFWGLIDARLDAAWVEALCDPRSGPGGSVVLVGPRQAPDARLGRLAGLVMPGAAGYDALPGLAAAADALVMPYADLPVTRAMQPLKFKEYLATGKPVIVRDLPATRPWADAADVVRDAGAFVLRVRERVQTGVPAGQAAARGRLAGESWEQKARQFEQAVLAAAGAVQEN